MASDHDRDFDFEILKKSLTTAHLEMPDFGPEPEPTPQEAPATPSAPQSTDTE